MRISRQIFNSIVHTTQIAVMTITIELLKRAKLRRGMWHVDC